MKTNTKKIVASFFILLLFFQILMPSVMAAEIGESYYLQRGPKAFYSVQKLMDDGRWVYITYEIVYYTDKEGKQQIAYCLDPELPGVGWAGGSIEGYNVKLTKTMSDVKIWRACINGYPYKSAIQLGVETNEDAYLATKQAINCILRGYTPDEVYKYYREGDVVIEGQKLEEIQRRGKKVVDAIYNLVNNAYNSTGTPANSQNINANKINNFIKDSNKEGYYSQEYSVKSNINMESYAITKLSSFPEGTIVTDVKGNIKNTFSKNENFRVLIPEDKLNENISGAIELKAKSENYPIFFGLSELQGYQDYAVCCEPYGDIPKTINLDINTNVAKIQINKVDLDTNVPIADVEFQLSKDNSVIATTTTNKNGVAIFSNLYPGNYILKEISTNPSYVLDTKEISVTVGFNEVINLKATNTKKKGKIQVIKVDKDNNNIKIPGVTFEVLNENKNVVDTIKTNTKGQAITKDLPIDQIYTVREKETKEEYVLTEETQTVKLEQDKIKTIQFENEKKKGQIKIIKVDKDYAQIRIANVEFKIYNSKGEVVDTITTDENGEAISKRLPIDDTYTIKETKTDRKYILNENSVTITLKHNEIKEQIITNEHKKGDLIVYKVDKDNEKMSLGSIEFNLFSEEFNKVIGSYITNADGEISVSDLRIGNYKLIETKTNKWYNLAENVQVEIKHDEITNTYVENELKKGQVKVIKVDAENNEIKLQGVTFEVLDKNNNVLEIITTDENGEAITKEYAIRDYEEIKIREIETNKFYILNDETKTVKLEENQIKVLEFQNQKKKGQIKVIKVDLDNSKVKLEGVTFDIFDEKGNVVETVITDSNGEAITKKLPIDQAYTIVEKETREGYVLTEKTQTVILRQDEIKNIIFQNEKQKGQIEVYKTDEDNKEYKLEGVEFEVINSNNEVVEIITTNKDGYAITSRLPIGQYQVKEVKTNSNYILNEEIVEVNVETDIISKLEITNEKIKGYFNICKTSLDKNEYLYKEAGTPLKDAIFEIRNEKGEVIYIVKTNEQGKFDQDLILGKGKYTIQEIKAPDYYILDETKYEFEIKDNKQKIELELTNKSQVKKLPKTGY